MTKLALADRAEVCLDAATMAAEIMVSPVTLEGRYVRLEPLAKAHLAGLAEVGLDEELWRGAPPQGRAPEEKAGYTETPPGEQERGGSPPVADLDKHTAPPPRPHPPHHTPP